MVCIIITWVAYLGAFPAQFRQVITVLPPMQEIWSGSSCIMEMEVMGCEGTWAMLRCWGKLFDKAKVKSCQDWVDELLSPLPVRLI